MLGRFDRLGIALMHLATLLLLWLGGVLMALGWPYYVGLLVAAGMAIYQQGMIRGRDPRQAFAAFLHNHYFGMAVFVGIVVNYMVNV